MIGGISTIERAYQLAKSGEFRTVSNIKDRLHAEGFTDGIAQVTGRTLTNALRRLISAARPET
jgi:LmbE family N-acetylglucosaminyl deacetylase